MNDLVLGIVGSRKLDGHVRAYRVIHEYLSALKPDKITSGGAIGIDSMGVEVALAMGYTEDQIIIHEPKPRSGSRWDYVSALFARNTLIVEDSTDLLAIMVPGGSNGTLDTVKKAKAKPISCYVIYIEPNDPERCIHCDVSHDQHGSRMDHFFE